VLPSVAALDTSSHQAIGRWGESLVYHYLAANKPGWKVKWMNEEVESLASYDIHLNQGNGALRSSRFVEVKSSRYPDKNVFEVSLNEWEFFSKNGGASINYDIYRVFNAGNPSSVFIAVVEDPLRLLEEQRIQLCLAI